MPRVVSIIIPNTHKLWVKGISLSVYSRSYDSYSQEQDYTELGKLVHDFKYQRFMSESRRSSIIQDCSDAIISKMHLLESSNTGIFDCVIPVPPNINSDLSLPSEVSKYLATKLPRLTDGGASIIRVKPIPSMKSISKIEMRAEILRGAYELETEKLPKDLSGFLIIDDVYETGSTIREVSRTLKRYFPEIPRYVITITHLKGVWSQRR